MPSRKPQITEERYNLLCEAFRQAPGNVANAARHAAVNWKTADVGWKRGWPKKKFPPIEQLLKEEQIQARAILQAELAARRAQEQRAKEEARENAIETRKEEGLVVKIARKQSLGLLQSALQIASASSGVAGLLRDALVDAIATKRRWLQYEKDVAAGLSPVKPKGKVGLSISEMSYLLERAAKTNERIVATARQAMEMERLHLGQPTEIIGVAEEGREMTLEELSIRKRAALQAIESAERAGGLTLLPGGLDVGRLVETQGESLEVGERVRLSAAGTELVEEDVG